MQKIITALFILLIFTAKAQNSSVKPAILYGSIVKEKLQAVPYAKWFDSEYNAYKSDETILAQLKKQNLKDVTIQIFFGTWCSDSQKEVPRFFKLLNEIGFSSDNIHLIALGNSDSLYKQSPQHEEKGLGIFRVPTIIIYKNGKELNRINESPVFSLEKDLLNIITNQPYSSNYPSLKIIKQWLSDSTIADSNVSVKSLSEQLKPIINNENELNNLGYCLLMGQDTKKEALKIFKINFNLYHEASNVISSLGEGFYENGDNANAILYLEKALGLIKKPEEVKPILQLLYKVKGIK